MTEFWPLAILLAVAAAAFVVLPAVWSRRVSRSFDREAVNVALYRDRLGELEAERDSGIVTAESFDELKAELARSLLDYAGQVSERAHAGGPGTRLLAGCALAVPVLALVLYADWGFDRGAIDDLKLSEALEAADETSRGALLSQLQEQLLGQPENYEGWFMLGSQLLGVGRFEEGAAAFLHLRDEFPSDGNIAARYTEALFLADKRAMTPRVSAAIDATLAVDPGNVTMLELRGMHAMSESDPATALRYFRAAAAALPEGRRKMMVQQAISTIEGSERVPEQRRRIDVDLSLSAGVEIQGDDTVFLFARAVAGPRMPLAVQRIPAAELPMRATLDDSMGMMPGMSIADFPNVQVVARLTRGATVDAANTLSETVSEAIELGKEPVSLALEIRPSDG